MLVMNGYKTAHLLSYSAILLKDVSKTINKQLQLLTKVVLEITYGGKKNGI